MLLKIHLLQLMSIGLITVQLKAEEESLAEVPELYMLDSDKALLNRIWNIAGFPSNQNEQNPEVTRKFWGMLVKVAPKIIKSVIPKGKMPGFLQKVGTDLLKNSITQLGEIPGFPNKVKPVLPVVASLIPQFGKLIDVTGTNHTNNNNRQHSRTDRSYADSPDTINHKMLPKPSNSEFVSKRSALYQENADLDNSDRNNNTETNAKYYLTDNLKTSPEDLETVNLAIEPMKRMMQFPDVDGNIHNKNKTWNFWQRKIHQNMDTTSTVDLENRNSHMDYMHKKAYKTFNTAGYKPIDTSISE